MVIPDRILFKIPDNITYDEAALVEPAGVAAHAIAITPLKMNETIAVVGTGLIGLLVIQILKATTSGRVLAFDTLAERRERALEFGADAAFDPANSEKVQTVMRI